MPSPNMPKDTIAERALKALGKKYVAINKNRVKSWQVWLLMGIGFGVLGGAGYVINQSGTFSGTFAAVKPSAILGYRISSIGGVEGAPPATITITKVNKNGIVIKTIGSYTDNPYNTGYTLSEGIYAVTSSVPDGYEVSYGPLSVDSTNKDPWNASSYTKGTSVTIDTRQFKDKAIGLWWRYEPIVGQAQPYTCVPSDPSVKFVTQVLPPGQMSPGDKVDVSITVANCGTATWKKWDGSTGYRLSSQLPQGNTTWRKGRVDLPIDLMPNQKVTIPFSITAPTEEGTYAYQWSLLNVGEERMKPYSPPAIIGVGKIVTCPKADMVKDTGSDATAVLQHCVNATPLGKTLEIPAGTYTLLNQVKIRQSITLRTAGTAGNTKTCLTSDAPDCVIIKAAPSFPTSRNLWKDAFGLFHIDKVDNVTFDHIVLDGNRANRDPATGVFCDSDPNYYHFCVNIEWFGNDSKIFYSASINSFKSTGFGLNGKNNVFAYNFLAENGDHYTSFRRWADGTTCTDCDHVTMMYNTFKDNSDLDVVIANATGANIQFNTILHQDPAKASWAGLGFDNFGSASLIDFTGADISYNSVDCGNYRCGFGLLLGGHPWYSGAPLNWGGYVHDNTITRARQGVNIDGFGTPQYPLRYENNIVTDSGNFDTGCGWKSGVFNLSPDSTVTLGSKDIPDSNLLWHDCTFNIPQ